MRPASARSSRLLVLGCLVAISVTLLLVGCDGGTDAGGPADPVVPDAPDLSSPESAVRSYLDWISYAYRMAESDLASPTVTPWEGVRVDSYIELNRQDGKGLEQSLSVFEIRSQSIEGTGAVVAAYEEWRYRYFSLAQGRYDGPEYNTSYDTTYTLVLEGDTWLVDGVQATPLTPLPE